MLTKTTSPATLAAILLLALSVFLGLVISNAPQLGLSTGEMQLLGLAALAVSVGLSQLPRVQGEPPLLTAPVVTPLVTPPAVSGGTPLTLAVEDLVTLVTTAALHGAGLTAVTPVTPSAPPAPSVATPLVVTTPPASTTINLP